MPLSTPPDTEDTSAFSLRDLRKHWILGLLVTVTVVVAVVFYTVGQKKIYRAAATIQIDPNPPRPLGKDVQTVVDMGSGSFWSNKEYFDTQTKILAGTAIARETARALSLQRDTAFLGNLPAGATPPPATRAVDLDAAASAVQGRLIVEPVKDTRLVVVNVEDANPERARRILSSLVQIYLERNVDQAVSSTAAASEWLGDQTEKLKNELERSELALHEYKKDKQILSVSLDDQSNMLRGEMQQLNEALTHARAKHQELKARAAELDKIDSNEPTTIPSTELLNSGLLSSLRQSYLGARSESNALLGNGKGENHPNVVGSRARVETTRLSLMNEVRNVQGAVRSDLAAISQEEAGLSGLVERAKQRALDLNMLEIEYRRLERTKTNTEKLYGLVLERSKETDLTGMMRFNNIRVIEPATAGRGPVRPRVPFNIAMGLFVGLVLGGATAFARGRLDQTVRVPQDLEAEFGLPFLGVVPSMSGRAKTSSYYSRRRHQGTHKQSSSGTDETSVELLAHTMPSSHAAECARVIRTSLTFASPDKPYRRILVTSGRPAEGKTTVAATIAIAFAQAGQRVLLMDCDLRRARIHRVFGCTNGEGVSTALQDASAIERSVIKTQVPNLFIMPGGPHVPNPAEIVQSESFHRMVDELGQRFDRIVIDSPPILAVADASIIATRVDITVFVARVGKTQVDVTRQALRKLRELNAPIAGFVLNALEAPRWGTRYYYSYYGYGKPQYGTYGVGGEA